MHPFHQFISKFNSLKESEWLAVEKCLSRKEYAAGTRILEAGQVCRKLYFVEEGLLRFFTLRDGIERSKFFTIAPYCFTSQRSFTAQTASNDTIETLEKSVIWEMSQANAFDLFQYPGWNEFVRKLIQEVQFNTEQILEANQAQTAESRYIQMIESGSTLLKRVPLKYIASYLGIAPQSLSRIRKKYFEEQRKLT